MTSLCLRTSQRQTWQRFGLYGLGNTPSEPNLPHHSIDGALQLRQQIQSHSVHFKSRSPFSTTLPIKPPNPWIFEETKLPNLSMFTLNYIII